MAESSNNLNDVLKPFFERAAESEVRLSRLEVALGSKDSGNEELLKLVNDLQSELEETKSKHAAELEETKSEHVAELEKNRKLEAENGKLKYRITHLVRALENV